MTIKRDKSKSKEAKIFHFRNVVPLLILFLILFSFNFQNSKLGTQPVEENNSTPLIILAQPDPVITFKVLSIDNGSMKLIWSASTPSDFYCYNIYRIRGYELFFTPSLSNLLIQIFNNNTLEYIDPQYNLFDQELYTYKIAIANELGDSNYKLGYNSTHGDGTAPIAPLWLNITNEGTGDVLNITWIVNPEEDVDHYNIYRNSTTEDWSLIDNSLNNYYQDGVPYLELLVEYKTYFYYIIAVDEAGNEGSPSLIVSGIPIDYIAPTPPIIYAIIPMGRTLINVIRDPFHRASDILSYNLYRSNCSGGPYQLIEFNYSKSGEYTFIFDCDLPLGDHYYVVTAFDEKYQQSAYSNEQCYIIDLFSPNITIIDNTNGDLNIYWSDNVSNYILGIDKYNLYYMNSSESLPILLTTIDVPTHTTVTQYSYSIYGFPNGNWTFYITTIDEYAGESLLSTPYNITIHDLTGPGAPTGLNATPIGPPGSPNFTLSWNRPADLNYGGDVLSYQIYMSTEILTNFTGLISNGTISGSLTSEGFFNVYPSTNYSFYNLLDGTYYLSVVAIDELNQSSNFSVQTTYTVDTTNPTIYENTLTDLTSLEILAREEVMINVTIYDAGGISHVYINYNVDGVPQIVEMSLISVLPNGSQIYGGCIPGQPANSKVNFTIIVEDVYGYRTESNEYEYSIGSCCKWPPINTVLLIIIISSVVGGLFLFHKLRLIPTQTYFY